MRKIVLWDIPLRIFHWSLATLVVLAFITGLTAGGWMDWHGRIGAIIGGLIGFRVAWGFVGSTYARFASFIKGPASIIQYLQGNWRGVGHNPLGALSVIGMLFILSLQIFTGLFANDDVAFQGPYNLFVDKSTELLAIFLHKRIFWLIGFMVALHLLAIIYYSRVKGDNLVKPMFYGEKEIKATHGTETPADAKGGGLLAILAALFIALTLGWLAWGGPVTYLAPPPPAPTATPNW